MGVVTARLDKEQILSCLCTGGRVEWILFESGPGLSPRVRRARALQYFTRVQNGDDKRKDVRAASRRAPAPAAGAPPAARGLQAPSALAAAATPPPPWRKIDVRNGLVGLQKNTRLFIGAIERDSSLLRVHRWLTKKKSKTESTRTFAADQFLFVVLIQEAFFVSYAA